MMSYRMVLAGLLLGILPGLTGCHRPVATEPQKSPDALQREAQKLQKEHEKESQNK